MNNAYCSCRIRRGTFSAARRRPPEPVIRLFSIVLPYARYNALMDKKGTRA